MGKITETRKLYKETLKELTKTEENWLSFLDSSSWNFKYDFADQILIYAQRPEATACADIETWNNKVKRWINKNANGIFIFDNNENSQYPFKLVFDVSDTHNYKGTPYKLWSVEEKYEMDIIESLDATFGAESENLDLSTSITLNAYNMVTDNIQDYMSSIKKYIKGTKFEEYSDRDIYNIFVPCVWGSVSYMMMTRCGINAREKIDIKEFSYIKEFNNDNLITILGQAVSDIAELGLREIVEFFKDNLENNNKAKEFLVEIFGKEYNEFVINDDRVGYKLYNKGIYLWKGNYLNRTEKCFLKWENFVEYCISYAQMNEINDVFEIPTENEQKPNIADVENTPAFFVSQEIIDNDLQRGSGFENGKFRIYQQFLKGETNIKNADFLKNEYGIGGHTVEIGGLFQNHDSKGITFEEFKTSRKYLLKWTQVAKRIGELITADRYLSEQEKDEYNDWLDANGIFHNPKEDIINDEDYKLAERLHSFIKDYDYYSYLDNSPIENTEQDNIDLIRADIDDEMNIKNYIDFLKTAIEESEPDYEMLPEAKELLEELEKRLPYYEFNNGDIVYIGIDEYEIRSINDNIVELADTKFPLFTKEMPRKEFDKKFKENPANDKLRTGKRLLDLEKEEKSIIDKNEDIEIEQKDVSSKINENDENIEKVLKANIKPKRRNRIEYFDLHPEIPLDERNNYHIDNNNLGVGTPKQKFRRNVEAIKILKQCDEENRYATKEEHEILAEYVGWGGLADAFDSQNDNWAEENKELKDLLTEKEYSEARQSTLTAFYTPPVVISSIYKALEKMGLEKGKYIRAKLSELVTFLEDYLKH